MNNEFNPNPEVKKAIQDFNIDSNSKCDAADTIDEKILKEIAKEIINFSNDFSYNFNDPHKREALQKEIDKYLLSLSRDSKITEEINHSKFPDDVVLIIINSRGIKINSISILKSFDAIEIKEPYRCGYSFNITFESMVNAITIECDIVSEKDEDTTNMFVDKVITNKEMWDIVNRTYAIDPDEHQITESINKTKIDDSIISELIHKGNPDLNLEDFAEIMYAINPNNTYTFLGRLKGQDIHFNILHDAYFNINNSITSKISTNNLNELKGVK